MTQTNRDEEKERRLREARRAQMKREKQLQEQRRRFIKKYLPPAAGLIGIVIVIAMMAATLGKNLKANELQQSVVTESGATISSQKEFVENRADVSGVTGIEIDAKVHGDTNGLQETADEMQKNANGLQGDEAVEKESNSMVYRFESDADSVTIYSEEVVSTQAVLVNESTGTIVASKGAGERISPASMTKVLTVLVAAEHIAKEDLDDTFTMTSEITDYAYVNDCSSVGFSADETVAVRDLFYGTILPSGADAAVGLATCVAGSHEAFVDMMNAKLEELGLSDSAHFTNCVGLYDENHYCTVYDMAIIMKAALQNELCREVLSKHTYTTVKTAQHPEGIEISNWFLRRIEDKDTGGEVLCAKTGYVTESKNCAVSYGTFSDGVPYICVTAGATSSWRCIYDHVEIYNRYVK